MIDRRKFLAGLAAAVPLGATGAAALEIDLPAAFQPQFVAYHQDVSPGQIIIDSSTNYLYYVTQPGVALRYAVASGKESLAFRGSAVIGRKVEWPSWKPTPQMIERQPEVYAKYADGMPGGPTNPLGARALYFYQNGRDTAIRIHGTTAPNSIGRRVSNGCFRMVNEHVIDLFNRVPVGTKVTVY